MDLTPEPLPSRFSTMPDVQCGQCGKKSNVRIGGRFQCRCGNMLSVQIEGECQSRTARLLAQRPGDALRSVIASRGYVGKSGCGCDDRVAEMNRKGLQWCVDNREEIIGWLKESARQRWISAAVVRFAPGIVTGICNDMLDDAFEMAGHIVDSRLAIITTHWNPSEFSKPIETYYRWQATIPRKIRVMEAVYSGRQRDIPSSKHFEAGIDSILWQKERLINLAIKSLPKQVKWVAWVDHDLIFENDRWVEDAVVQLSRGMDVVQLFDQVKYTDRDGNVTETRHGAAAILAQGQEPDCAPGGAWMASRKWLDSIGGLYDLNICGGGDATFFQAITGFHTRYLTRQTPALREDCLRYVSRVNKAKWGFVKGSVVHMWHGDRANRQYISRDAILDQWSFDPQKHLRTTQNGLLAWSDLAPKGLRRAVANYFADRREDG
jgi:hypothetical protein